MTMTRRLVLGSAFAAGLVGLLPGLAPSGSWAAGPQVGKPAPVFSGTDSDGRTIRLEDYRGKVVVLEWTNHECPFVMKHYGGQAMQGLQKKWTEAGIIWLSVVSSAPGEQGAVNGQTANRLTQSRGAVPTAVILDAAGTIGRAFDAKTTPHMAIVSAEGTLLYQGGIDDKPSANLDDLKTAKNFVDAALTEISTGKPVSIPTARAYGCTVKYAS